MTEHEVEVRGFRKILVFFFRRPLFIFWLIALAIGWLPFAIEVADQKHVGFHQLELLVAYIGFLVFFGAAAIRESILLKLIKRLR